MHRSHALLPAAVLLLASLAPAAPAQQDLLTLNGGSFGGQFGYAVANAGDCDGDGRDDVAVGSPFDDTAAVDQGRVRCYSGATGALLWTAVGDAAGDQLGQSIATVGDVNGDGRSDLVVGAPYADPNGANSGRVKILSGANGSTLLTLNGVAAGDRFGWSVAYGGAPFLGTKRIVVGAPFRDTGGADAGSAYVYTVTGTLLKEFTGAQAGEHRGWSVAGALDVNGDLSPDVIVGAPDSDVIAADNGRVYVFSGASPYPQLYERLGAVGGDRFGFSVAALANIDNDGFGDFVVGSPGASSGNGRVTVHSGGNAGAQLTSKSGVPGQSLGWSVASLGDVNLDGRTDWIVGAPDDPAAGAVGRALVYSGLTHALLTTLSGTNPNGRFGAAVGGGGDVNGDGRPDPIVGSPDAAILGPEQGNVRVFSGNGFGQLLGIDGPTNGDRLGGALCSIGDVNGDGRADFLVGSPQADHTFYVLLQPVTHENAGSVRCISGIDGSTLWTIWGDGEGDELGASVASLGYDFNVDGVDDFVVGAPQRLTASPAGGYARVCTGLNGATLGTVVEATASSEFGAAVANAGDVTGDGRPEALVGSPGFSGGRGRIAVMLGGLFVEVSIGPLSIGQQAGERFGSSVAALGDVNGDAKSDLLVGAPSNDAVGVDAGRAYAISTGGAGSLLFTLSGTNAGDLFGSSVCSLGDFTGDDVTDVLAVGAPGADYAPLGLTNCGSVRSFFVVSLSDYWVVFGQGSHDLLGSTIANVGDYSNDGFDDLIAGAPENFFFSLGTGYAQVVSGWYGVVSYTFPGSTLGEGFGLAVAAGGDVDANGTLDALVGSPFASPSGPSSGRAKAISLQPAGVIYYGTGSAGCAGDQRLRNSMAPRIGTYWFTWGVNNAPPSSLGLLLASDSPDFVGSDPFGIGVPLLVDLIFATEVYGLDINSTVEGFGIAVTPIANNPILVGKHYYGQTLWAWGSCPLPPYGLSTSHAANIQIQP